MAFQIRLLLHAALYSLFSPSVDRSRHGQKNVSIFPDSIVFCTLIDIHCFVMLWTSLKAEEEHYRFPDVLLTR